MRKIKEDIKNNSYKKVYLIFGEEKYLVHNVKKVLRNALKNGEDDFNYCEYYGKETDEKEVIEFAETMPFLSEHRVVLAENTGWFKKATDKISDYIADYDNIPDTAIIIFIEDEVDKRNKLYKSVKSKGYICDCSRPGRNELIQWVSKFFSNNGKIVSGKTAAYIVDTVGMDMNILSGELEKLLTYPSDDNTITEELVDYVCIPEIKGKIFEMIDMIGNKQSERAMELYYDLIAVREAPLKILILLTRQFNSLYQVKELLNMGYGYREISDKTKINDFILKKYVRQCDNFKLSTLKKAFAYCVNLDEAIKKGNVNDKIAVELVILKYSA